MCRLRKIAMGDYQESVTSGQTHRWTDGQTDTGQSDPYVPLCFTGDTKIMLVPPQLREEIQKEHILPFWESYFNPK